MPVGRFPVLAPMKDAQRSHRAGEVSSGTFRNLRPLSRFASWPPTHRVSHGQEARCPSRPEDMS